MTPAILPRFALTWLLLAALLTGAAQAEAPTLGGRLYWGDELVFHEWRIQRNVITSHCRLLDGENRRHGWGTFEHCRRELERIKRERSLPPLPSRVVVALHGLFRTRLAMDGMDQYIEKHSELEVLTVTYPTTQNALAEHAAALASVLEHLEGVEHIDLVAHSMGNLVLRRYLADHTDPERGLQPDPRLHRIVMLAPPNQGADLARLFEGAQFLDALAGDSAEELVHRWEDVEKRLATPTCEFGILAGGTIDGQGRNPLLEGDDDFIVRVEETLLPGAADFIVLPVLHMFMPNSELVQEHTLRFLQHGYFVAADQRRPIPVEAER